MSCNVSVDAWMDDAMQNSELDVQPGTSHQSEPVKRSGIECHFNLN